MNLEPSGRSAQKLFGSCREPATLLAAEPVFEVGGAALQSEEEEEGEGRMKEREAPSEHVTRRRRRRRGLGGVGPSHLLQPPVSRFPVWRAAAREREGGRRGRGAPDAAGVVTDMRGLLLSVARSPLCRGSATALWL